MTFNSKLKDELVDKLFEAILLLKMKKNAIGFEDICTVSEIKSLAQRLKLQKCLLRIKLHFYFQETGASTATVSRVKRSLTMVPAGIS